MKESKKEKNTASKAAANSAEKKSGGKSLPSATTLQTMEKEPNNTGLPDNLKTSLENLSGYSMSDTRVHYNSQKPESLQAHAYAQGTDIHLAPGQEKHLPHEAWHIVQQKQGRVQPTTQMKGANINDDRSLEEEADRMGAKAAQMKQEPAQLKKKNKSGVTNPIQLKSPMEEVLEREEAQSTTTEDVGSAGGVIGLGGTASDTINTWKHGEASLKNMTSTTSDASKSAGILSSAGNILASGSQIAGGMSDASGAIDKYKGGVYSGNKAKAIRASGRGLDRLAQTTSAVTSGVQSIAAAGGAFGNTGMANLGFGMNAAGGAVPIAGAVTGGISMARGLWNVGLAHKRKKALEAHNFHAGNEGAVEHLKELQGKRRKRGAMNALTGAMGMTAGILAATGVAAPVAAVLAGGAAAISAGNAIYKKIRQGRRDDAARYNKWAEMPGSDQEKADKIRQEKLVAAQKTIDEGKNSWNPLKKFSAWRAEKKKAAIDANPDYGKTKLEKYKKADAERKATLATTSGVKNWFKRKMAADINKSTEKKHARQASTADSILAMSGEASKEGDKKSDKESALASIGLASDVRDNAVREFLIATGKKPTEVKEKTWDDLSVDQQKQLIITKIRKGS